MPSRRFYANNAPQATLSLGIGSANTTLSVASFAGYPTSFPFFASLDYGTGSMEIISVTNISGTTATVVRGQGGTAAVAHPAGSTLDFAVVAQDLDEANAHTSSNAGVHGVTGSVVGTTDAQTLTQKTLTSPTINGGSTSGTTVGASTVTTTGDVTVGGNVTASNGAVLQKGLVCQISFDTNTIPIGSSGSAVTITGGTVDRDSLGAGGAAAGTITIPAGQGGQYKLSAILSTNCTGSGRQAAQICKNGITHPIYSATVATAPSGQTSTALPDKEYTLAAGDVLTLIGFSTVAGGNATGAGSTFLRAERIF